MSALGGVETYGDDAASVWGGLTGAEIGELHGVAGLGLVGSGRGGDGEGDGVLGLGDVGLIGCGCGEGQGSTYARGFGVALAGRKPRAPRVHQARAQVEGGLAEAVVRRVVRMHQNEIRHCYDLALTRDPQAKGRLTLEFLIGDAGQVRSAMVGEGSVRDEVLGPCVVQAARRWQFPRAASGGGTLVTFPFTFEQL